MVETRHLQPKKLGEHEKRAHHITEATMLESLPMSRPRLELRTERWGDGDGKIMEVTSDLTNHSMYSTYRFAYCTCNMY